LLPPRQCWRAAGTNVAVAQVFRCLADSRNRFATEGSSYEWNYELNAHRIDEPQTSTAFLLLKPGKNVVYMDGHVGALEAGAGK